MLGRIRIVALLLCGLLAGCAMRMEIGAPPRVDRLDQLRPRISTASDVLLLLGEPRGHGAARLDPTFPRQRVWYYEHIVSEGSKVSTAMLVVFFTDGTYDGHMWFADAVSYDLQAGRTER
jgi:outer membrane protein assembly factor BamE (lipoprotein component of BamABCDE complex)